MMLFSFLRLDKWLKPWWKPPTPQDDPNKIYIQNSRTRFLKLLSDSKYSSSNIVDLIYNKKTLHEVLMDSGNELEKSWRTRLLMESTPIGNIVMFYDIFKQGFSYYCDQPIVQYDILNSVAMKYVMRFSCVDFFMDEYILGDIRTSPLKAVFIDDDQKKEEKKHGNELAIDMKTAPFAKLKNYSTTSKKEKQSAGPVSPLFFRTKYPWLWKIWFRIQYYVIFPIYNLGFWTWSSTTRKIFGDKEKPLVVENSNEKKPEEPEKIRNKFIYLGRFRNLNILQKPVKNSVFSGGSTKYDSMFGCVGGKAISYKDFKPLKIKPSKITNGTP